MRPKLSKFGNPLASSTSTLSTPTSSALPIDAEALALSAAGDLIHSWQQEARPLRDWTATHEGQPPVLGWYQCVGGVVASHAACSSSDVRITLPW